MTDVATDGKQPFALLVVGPATRIPSTRRVYRHRRGAHDDRRLERRRRPRPSQRPGSKPVHFADKMLKNLPLSSKP